MCGGIRHWWRPQRCSWCGGHGDATIRGCAHAWGICRQNPPTFAQTRPQVESQLADGVQPITMWGPMCKKNSSRELRTIRQPATGQTKGEDGPGPGLASMSPSEVRSGIQGRGRGGEVLSRPGQSMVCGPGAVRSVGWVAPVRSMRTRRFGLCSLPGGGHSRHALAAGQARAAWTTI